MSNGSSGRLARTVPSPGSRRPVRLALVLAVGLIGCGDATGPASELPDSPAAALLSFEAIEGDWVGTVTEQISPPSGEDSREITFKANLVFNRKEAPRGGDVGTVAYSDVEDPLLPGREMSCGGSLVARRAEGREYEVAEQLTYGTDQCRNGTIQLTHDPDSGTLSYEYFFNGQLHATASLTRN